MGNDFKQQDLLSLLSVFFKNLSYKSFFLRVYQYH